MGIRVHKAVGWGISNQPHLFQSQGIEKRYRTWWESSPKMDLARFKRFLLRNRKKVLQVWAKMGVHPNMLKHVSSPKSFKSHVEIELECMYHSKERQARFQRVSVCLESEFGLKDTLLLVESPDHFRYDDTMDWVEETEVHHGLPRFQVLKSHHQGIFPHDSGYPGILIPGLLVWFRLETLAPHLKPSLYVWWS